MVDPLLRQHLNLQTTKCVLLIEVHTALSIVCILRQMAWKLNV